MTQTSEQRRAAVVGIGMVGGSVAAALRARGWWVVGYDLDPLHLAEAVRRGIIDEHGPFAEGESPANIEITFIATPVSEIPAAAHAALARGGLVTDVGSVKAPIVAAVEHDCFVGGHPMAGSEKAGLDGVNPQLFEGATWVLTPGSITAGETYLEVHNVITSLGAEVVTLEAEQHDRVVATISHVPHLASSALMTLATRRSPGDDVLLRLAAGGFRDMTRIAAGDSGLWSDIVLQNRQPITDGLKELRSTLDELLQVLDGQDRDALASFLSTASTARKELPLRQGRPSELVSLSIVIPDRPGALGEVFANLGEAKVNIEDIEINHALAGNQGTLMLTVNAATASRGADALRAAGFVVGEEAL